MARAAGLADLSHDEAGEARPLRRWYQRLDLMVESPSPGAERVSTVKSNRARGGRPSKLTMETALVIVTALGRGVKFHEAAKGAGLGPATLYRWLALGRRGDPRFVMLAEAVGQARAAARSEGALAALALSVLRSGMF